MSEEQMRVYLPSTLPALAAALDTSEFGSPPICAFAVTPALREWYASGDLDALEYTALTAAARASLRLLAADPVAPRRRVVLAAEIPGEKVCRGDSHADRATVLVGSAVPLDKIVSAHIDDIIAAPDVHTAIGALPAADKGDQDAKFLVDSAEGHELLWYAAAELGYVC
ncbi:MAG TPA: hypothetical protein VLW50_33010 [Streptosporangiaceae bacterium]|nr:hypothetical protein [Streptosporangiaceae bacterium]